MNNNLNKILEKIDNGFVDNYEQMLLYKEYINELLIQMDIHEFKDYNSFCIKIKDSFKEELLLNDNLKIDNNFTSYIINKIFREKIKEDKNYKNKLDKFFNIDNSECLLKNKYFNNI